MAGAFVKVDLTGREEIKKALNRLARRGRDLTPVFDDMGEYLLEAHEGRFDAGRSPEGDPWEPLSPRYKARKKRNKGKILVLDDILGGTLRYQTTAGSLLFGTDRVYGATHQFGRADAGIPARPFLGLSSDDGKEMLRLAGEHLAAAL